MSVNKDKKPKLSEKGQAKYFIEAAESTPADQIYREIAKNSLEACARMKKIEPHFKGKIRVGEDPTFPNKLTIVDNAIGMSKHNISDLIINLSETEEESEHGNKGVGTKVSGFANNKKGMIYTSKRYNEDEGSRCRVYFNDNDLFAVEHSDEYKSCTIPLDLDELPALIKKYKRGTSLTLCGNSAEEITLNPPEDYDHGSLLQKSRLGIHWLKAYYNTKFFTIPNYIDFKVQIKREDRTNDEPVYGHKYWLNHFSSKAGILHHESAKIWWWLLSDRKGKRNSATDCVMNGQLGFINNDEMMELDFDSQGRKNPLRHWGLPFSCGDVVVIIEPKGFKQDQYRTDLKKNRSSLKNFKPIWKEFFMENMPQPLRENEESLRQKFSEKMADDTVFAKEINKWLKDMHFLHQHGTIPAQQMALKGFLTDAKGNLTGDFSGGTGSVIPGKQPKSNIGKSLLYAGLKDSKEKNLASRGQANALPEVILDHSKANDAEWVWYAYGDNKIYLNNKCRLIDYYAQAAHRLNKTHLFDSHRSNTITILKRKLQIHVAMTQFGLNNLSEEDKRELLQNDKVLSIVLLDPFHIIPAIVEMSKNLKQQLAALDKQEQHTNGSLKI